MRAHTHRHTPAHCLTNTHSLTSTQWCICNWQVQSNSVAGGNHSGQSPHSHHDTKKQSTSWTAFLWINSRKTLERESQQGHWCVSAHLIHPGTPPSHLPPLPALLPSPPTPITVDVANWNWTWSWILLSQRGWILVGRRKDCHQTRCLAAAPGPAGPLPCQIAFAFLEQKSWQPQMVSVVFLQKKLAYRFRKRPRNCNFIRTAKLHSNVSASRACVAHPVLTFKVKENSIKCDKWRGKSKKPFRLMR